MKRYELTFHGAAMAPYRLPRYKRIHPTRESAEAEAARVHWIMREKQLPVDAHPAIIHPA